MFEINTVKNNNIAFPFFGAGAATYHEYAEMTVRFKSAPNGNQGKKIHATLPEPLKVDALQGRLLTLNSDQGVNNKITKIYAASQNPAAEFEKSIENWLHEIHASCPIEFVLRWEDNNAQGTQLSKWHAASLAAIPNLLTGWAKDKYTYTQAEKTDFKTAAAGIFHFGNIALDAIPSKFLSDIFPDISQSRAEYLLEQVARYSKSDPSPYSRLRPRISHADINLLEEIFNLQLPNILRMIYTQIGNGGFGPFITLCTNEQAYFSAPLRYKAGLKEIEEQKNSHWRKGLLPFAYWGCDIYSCVDCFDPSYPVFRLDGAHDLLDEAQDEAPRLIQEAISIEQWVADWFEGNLKTETLSENLYAMS